MLTVRVSTCLSPQIIKENNSISDYYVLYMGGWSVVAELSGRRERNMVTKAPTRIVGDAKRSG